MNMLTPSHLKFASAILLLGFLCGAGTKNPEPLYKKSFKEIIRKYLFIADFSTKPPTRPVSKHLFWRYPIKTPKTYFPIFHPVDDVAKEFPTTPGDGRVYQHITAGRTLFMQGKFAEAKKVFLAARSIYGKTFAHHRRVDYFIGLSYLNEAHELLKASGNDWNNTDVRSAYSNVATFLSWALLIKRQNSDPLVEEISGKQFYNLAAIYYRYGRFGAAFGAAQSGLQHLSSRGSRDFRIKLRRIQAEAYVQNRTYLEAVQEFDTAIRQDPSPEDAAAMFARVGDIYFDLNNYELAEESYALANRIDQEVEQVTPAQFVLRGESLFWLGKFSDAQKMFYYAMETEGFRNSVSPLDDTLRAQAHLRLADAYLAQEKYAKAKLEYFRVQHDYRDSMEGRIAKVRSACLELPQFKGNNVKHAREVLESMRNDDIPGDARELAWACEVGSYATRERTEAMVTRVKEFYGRYPSSRFLKSLVTPIKEVKAAKLDAYFKAGKNYQAVTYFEQTREFLYKRINPKTKRNLFASYVDFYQPEKAREFWNAYSKSPDSDLKVLRQAVTAAELVEGKAGNAWKKRNKHFAKTLPLRKWNIKANDDSLKLVNRILALSTSDMHVAWLYNLSQHWTKQSPELTCRLGYPLLSRLESAPKRSPIPRSVLQKDLAGMIKARFPSLLETDETCAISLLNLEVRMAKGDPQGLAARYLSRQSWRMSRALASVFWDVSEQTLAAGNQETAKELWRIIRDKAPADAPEKDFAKVRADKSRTEYDQLWR